MSHDAVPLVPAGETTGSEHLVRMSTTIHPEVTEKNTAPFPGFNAVGLSVGDLLPFKHALLTNPPQSQNGPPDTDLPVELDCTESVKVRITPTRACHYLDFIDATTKAPLKDSSEFKLFVHDMIEGKSQVEPIAPGVYSIHLLNSYCVYSETLGRNVAMIYAKPSYKSLVLNLSDPAAKDVL
jgi:hypothetical protein